MKYSPVSMRIPPRCGGNYGVTLRHFRQGRAEGSIGDTHCLDGFCHLCGQFWRLGDLLFTQHAGKWRRRQSRRLDFVISRFKSRPVLSQKCASRLEHLDVQRPAGIVRSTYSARSACSAKVSDRTNFHRFFFQRLYQIAWFWIFHICRYSPSLLTKSACTPRWRMRP